MSPRPTDMENTMQDITPGQARDLYRDQNQAAALGRGPGVEPITKADLSATVDSYIEAGGEVHEHGHPRAGEPTDPGHTTTLRGTPMATFTYAIEVSDTGDVWMMENDDSAGTEKTPLTAIQLARVVLDNRLADLATETGIEGNPVQPGHMRVSVWEGPNIGDAQNTAAQTFAGE